MSSPVDVTSVNKLFMIPRMDLNGYQFFLRCEKLLTWLQLVKKKIPISYKRVGESLLYLGSLQINTSLFEQKQRTLTTSRMCWQYPLRPEFLIDFLQLGQTDIQKDSSLPFNIKNNEINVYCFFHQVRQGMNG